MAFHEQLVQATRAEREHFLSTPILQAALAGDIGQDDYTRFLEQAFHHVRHTVPLLMACGSRLPVHMEWLRTAVAEYIGEEVGHHEWILDDLAACGIDRIAAEHGTPSAATELMVAYAYDTIARNNPVGFFGMVFVLEGTSVAMATRAATRIESALALPRNAFSYLLSHGDLDIEHVGFFEKLMDRLDDTADQAAVIHAARRFFALYGDIFRTLQEQPVPRRRKEAA